MKSFLGACLLSLFATGALAAPLAPPTPNGQLLFRQDGEITISGFPAPITVARYSWLDSQNLLRSVSLVPASGTTSGYAVQMTFQIDLGGGNRQTVFINADPAGDGGFGYFVSHELFRHFSNNTDGTIASLHAADDSPLGRYLASTGTDASLGTLQAVHEYRLNYPRWGTVASIPNPDPGESTVSILSADHQFFSLPVVIRWTFIAGRDHPLWSVDYDLTAAGDHISTDVRGPYGVMHFNDGVGFDVTTLKWGDKYHFAADAGMADFGATALPVGGLAWVWTATNNGRRYNGLGSGLYELGIVDTVLRANSKYADGYSEHRLGTSATMAGCPTGMRAIPCDWEWAYQSFQYDYGPPARPKLAWGSTPYLGSSYTEVYNGVENIPLIGAKGHINYAVHIVFGQGGQGLPLTTGRAAAAMEPDPTLTIEVVPAGSGSVSYTVFGDTGGPYSVAAQVLAPWASVRATATPAAGYVFRGWAAPSCGAANPDNCAYACAGTPTAACMIAMSASKTVRPRFERSISDFNIDARSDLLWRNFSTGQVYRMFMNGLAITGQGLAYTEPNTQWKVVADADFNGDGTADLLWRNGTTGQVYLQPFTSGGLPAGGTVIHTEANAAWKIVYTPDLDGNGKADVLWWNSSTGQVYAMLMNGGAIIAQGLVHTEPNTAWRIVAVGDFAGSGKKNQLLWRNGITGQVFLMTVSVAGGVFSQTGQMIYQDVNTAWKILAAADFNGDGKSDILWRNDATGQVFLMLMNGGAIANQAMIYHEPNLAWQIVAQGDYNGDGKADLLWRNDATGQVYMMLMNGLATSSAAIVYTDANLQWHLLGPWEYSQ